MRRHMIRMGMAYENFFGPYLRFMRIKKQANFGQVKIAPLKLNTPGPHK